MISAEICCIELSDALARGATLCDLIRSSTQYVFAALLTSHLLVLLLIPRKDVPRVGPEERSRYESSFRYQCFQCLPIASCYPRGERFNCRRCLETRRDANLRR